MGSDTEQYQFEIAFYERLLATNPDFIDAMIPLADAYTKAGEYRKGLELDKRLARLNQNDERVFYNLACSYALLNMPDEALAALEKAIALGYNDVHHLERDPDLTHLRTHARYQACVSTLKQRHQNALQ